MIWISEKFSIIQQMINRVSCEPIEDRGNSMHSLYVPEVSEHWRNYAATILLLIMLNELSRNYSVQDSIGRPHMSRVDVHGVVGSHIIPQQTPIFEVYIVVH